jgi:hypothetical protein
MNISLVGLTLHVADVERSLNFYKRIPDSFDSLSHARHVRAAARG